jgi:HSP20 family protein
MSLIRRRGELSPAVSRKDLFWPFEQEFNQLLDSFFNDGNLIDKVRGKGGYPKMDVVAADGKWKIAVAVPGVKPEDVKVELLKDRVRISGKMEEKYQSPEGSQEYVKELRTSNFSREVLLPKEINEQEPTATLEHGMLTLEWSLPEIKEENTVKAIEVKVV